jgi:hypothetical protein
MKPQTNTFSKYSEDNIKKFDIKYTTLHKVHTTNSRGKNLCTYYESFLKLGIAQRSKRNEYLSTFLMLL